MDADSNMRVTRSSAMKQKKIMMMNNNNNNNNKNTSSTTLSEAADETTGGRKEAKVAGGTPAGGARLPKDHTSSPLPEDLQRLNDKLKMVLREAGHTTPSCERTSVRRNEAVGSSRDGEEYASPDIKCTPIVDDDFVTDIIITPTPSRASIQCESDIDTVTEIHGDTDDDEDDDEVTSSARAGGHPDEMLSKELESLVSKFSETAVTQSSAAVRAEEPLRGLPKSNSTHIRFDYEESDGENDSTAANTNKVGEAVAKLVAKPVEALRGTAAPCGTHTRFN